MQKDLRILKAVRWDPEFEGKFLSQEKRPSRESVRFSYEGRPRFDGKKLAEIERLRRRNHREIKPISDDVAVIFDAILDDYENIVELLDNVGTHRFGQVSQTLWGATTTKFSESGATIVSLAESFSRNLNRLSDVETEKMFPKILSAEGLASLLRQRLQDAHLIESVTVEVTDKLVADAAAGSHRVKLRKGAKFSVKDVDVLLYHEVFTHIVTALNGRRQPHAKWLAFDTPRCSSTQEGLAVFLEMLSGKTYPRRLRRIVDRIVLLGRVEDGESCGHMYDWLRERNYSHRESLNLVMRAFRGSDPDARSPFTKDISYLKGLIECFNFVHICLQENRQDLVPTLYAGKLELSEVPRLGQLIEDGIVEKPGWIPRELLDLDSLAGWFSYVIALGSIRDEGLQSQFVKLVSGR